MLHVGPLKAQQKWSVRKYRCSLFLCIGLGFMGTSSHCRHEQYSLFISTLCCSAETQTYLLHRPPAGLHSHWLSHNRCTLDSFTYVTTCLRSLPEEAAQWRTPQRTYKTFGQEEYPVSLSGLQITLCNEKQKTKKHMRSETGMQSCHSSTKLSSISWVQAVGGTYGIMLKHCRSYGPFMVYRCNNDSVAPIQPIQPLLHRRSLSLGVTACRALSLAVALAESLQVFSRLDILERTHQQTSPLASLNSSNTHTPL